MADILDGLQDHELDIIKKLLKESEQKAEQALKPKQVRDIVPIEKWLDNEYYVGKDGARLYDFWKAELVDIFGIHAGQYNEIILEGGLGTGKSTAGIYMLIRKLYEMSCYENIPALYNLMSTATIVFMYFTISRQQAEIAGFGQFRDTIDTIPYFKEYFARDPNINSALRFPERVLFLQGSSTGHQIGLNLIATILDEANFFNQGQVSDKQALSSVTTLHTSVINRGVSRFMTNGVNNSLSILISSPTYSSSYTQQRIAQAVTNPHTKVIKGRLWDVKPKGAYSSKMFPVFVGTEKLDPFIIEGTQDLGQLASTEGITLGEGSTVEEVVRNSDPRMLSLVDFVPVDFKPSYEKDVIQSLQDISGISTMPQGRLFSSRVLLNACIDEDAPELFTKTELVVSTRDNSEANNIAHYLQAEPQKKQSTRYVHMDQSTTTDCTGMSSAYVSGYVDRDGQKLPVVSIDFALRIKPPKPPEKISITRCRSFIIYLQKGLGLPLGLVTYDQFQSSESQQVLNEIGITAGQLSVDRTDEQYLTLVNLIFEGRLKAPRQVVELMATEIFDLIHYRERRKVDHPPDGSKDVMDSIVGSVWNAITNDSQQDEKRKEDGKNLARHNPKPEDEEQDIVQQQLLASYLAGSSLDLDKLGI